MKAIALYDATLREGSQAEDISFSLEDKLRITVRLDNLGVHYIEGGWPPMVSRGYSAQDCAGNRSIVPMMI